MKKIMLILACFSVSISFITAATEAKIDRDTNDITQFDYPFMLGEWYLINPAPTEGEADFLAIRLNIASDYSFTLEIQNLDFSVDYWEGEYSLSADRLVLGINSDTPQVYNYSLSHNQLVLNGIYFSKGYSSSLIGSWSSAEIKGDDILASEVSKLTLTLQPDFVFLFMSESADGDLAVYQGIYYHEGDDLVLMYEKGEQDSKYIVKNNTLTLKSNDFDMYTVMNRIE